MAERGFPESVKVTSVGDTVTAADTVYQLRVDLGIGPKEIAILLGIRFRIEMLSISANSIVRWALWKKQEGVWPSGGIDIGYIAGYSDIIASGGLAFGDGGKLGSLSEDFLFPRPVVLVRPPQFLYESELGQSFDVGAHFYYLIRRIKDKDLAKLMVKDHA